jgi:DNA-binding CsgD family transcriptional regulator
MRPNEELPGAGPTRGSNLGLALALPLLLAEWLSASRNPRLICDAKGKVLWQCPNLGRWLEQAGSIKLEREYLILLDKRVQAAFSEFLLDAARPDLAIGFVDETLGERLVLQCQRLEVPRFPAAFGLRILSDARGLESSFLHFEQNFGMTRQEAAICRMLLQGQTVQDIVETESRSPDTVRFHVRNIYQKIGVSSREALFARLRPYMFD